MIIETRNPKCHVRIVSLEYGEILAEMVRPSIRSVSIHRRLGEAAGSFQFVLLPRPLTPFQLPGVPSSWRDVLGVNDFVEISIEVPPRPRTIVMRGFIDTVTEQFSIQGGKPQRTVHVNGRDYGAVLLLTKLYFTDSHTSESVQIFEKWREGFEKLFAWKSGEPPDPEHAPLPPNAVTDAPQFAPRDLLQNIVESFYKPQEELVLRQLPTAPPLAFFPVTRALDTTNERALSTIAPTVMALNFPPFTDVWTLLRIYQHHPWRELYVSDILTGAGVSAETKNQALNGQIHITLDLKHPDGSITSTTRTVETDTPNFNLDYRVASEGSGLNARTNSSALTGP